MDVIEKLTVLIFHQLPVSPGIYLGTDGIPHSHYIASGLYLGSRKILSCDQGPVDEAFHKIGLHKYLQEYFIHTGQVAAFSQGTFDPTYDWCAGSHFPPQGFSAFNTVQGPGCLIYIRIFQQFYIFHGPDQYVFAAGNSFRRVAKPGSKCQGDQTGGRTALFERGGKGFHSFRGLRDYSKYTPCQSESPEAGIFKITEIHIL